MLTMNIFAGIIYLSQCRTTAALVDREHPKGSYQRLSDTTLNLIAILKQPLPILVAQFASMNDNGPDVVELLEKLGNRLLLRSVVGRHQGGHTHAHTPL